jgi:hypothetical protein
MAPSWTGPWNRAAVSWAYDGTGEALPDVWFRRKGGDFMKIWHLCYAALGIAVARWVFKRQAVPMDPVNRLRSSGLL